MGFSLLPKMVADSLMELSPTFLQSCNIRLLMLDFDNTIVPYTTNVPSERMQQWLKEMAASDIDICVVSNSHKDRVQRFCEAYDIACITHARKPFSKGIKQCIFRYGIPRKYCALAGDQIYTDVLGANCAGVHSILVRSIHNHTFWLKLRHFAELPFIFAARKRRIHHEEH